MLQRCSSTAPVQGWRYVYAVALFFAPDARDTPV